MPLPHKAAQSHSEPPFLSEGRITSKAAQTRWVAFLNVCEPSKNYEAKENGNDK